MHKFVAASLIGLGITALAAPVPLDNWVGWFSKAAGVFTILVGLCWLAPPEPPEDKFLTFVGNHADAVRDILDEARAQLLSEPYSVHVWAQHAEVILASKYYV